MSSATQLRPRPAVPGVDDLIAHIFPREEVMRGYVFGVPIRALCGVVIVPSRDPSQLPVCQGCLDERGRRVAGMMGLN